MGRNGNRGVEDGLLIFHSRLMLLYRVEDYVSGYPIKSLPQESIIYGENIKLCGRYILFYNM